MNIAALFLIEYFQNSDQNLRYTFRLEVVRGSHMYFGVLHFMSKMLNRYALLYPFPQLGITYAFYTYTSTLTFKNGVFDISRNPV